MSATRQSEGRQVDRIISGSRQERTCKEIASQEGGCQDRGQGRCQDGSQNRGKSDPQAGGQGSACQIFRQGCSQGAAQILQLIEVGSSKAIQPTRGGLKTFRTDPTTCAITDP